MNYENDNKLKAMMDLLDELRIAPYPAGMLTKILITLEHRSIKYLLDDLPEGETYSFYCEKLDAHLIDIVKKSR